jgi:NAD(P)-dependent dehydrogenase (short-subunit alcohol dehydrogenase family)
MPSGQVVVVTGASSGFGRLTTESLARDGHTVVAGMRDTQGRNAPSVRALQQLAQEEQIAISSIDMDVQSQASVENAVSDVVARHGHIDVIVQNAGHMTLGVAEAFTPEELAVVYDINVLGAQRVMRAALPHLREKRQGYVVWVGSSSTRGGHPPFLAPYFAAKAAMDALAESYAAELTRFQIDTTIVVPGAFTSGTNHFAHASTPGDTDREAAYENEYGQLRRSLTERLAAIVPADADVQDVADDIVRLVGLPAGTRPFRTHIDPSKDGSEIVSVVADRIRAEFYTRVGIEDLLSSNAAH